MKNVGALAKLPPIRARKGNSWSSEEAGAFLESSRDGDDCLYAAYVLALVLGLRKGEVLGLTWDHIEWIGWDKPCTTHGEEFCARCRDRHDISLVIDKQLQRAQTWPEAGHLVTDLRPQTGISGGKRGQAAQHAQDTDADEFQLSW
ncbi:integrase [Micromonospora luteifusca]|uniref:Integrase n=1 Tax=Micromonospora luteifusca TaxID=709860 RepID=A0ABS2M1Z4_9ACTN|nr:hypothetical protein [Micromonospora luteifusca]MBM7494048.1 integrase [Micromonospora luteifusca]